MDEGNEEQLVINEQDSIFDEIEGLNESLGSDALVDSFSSVMGSSQMPPSLTSSTPKASSAQKKSLLS